MWSLLLDTAAAVTSWPMGQRELQIHSCPHWATSCRDQLCGQPGLAGERGGGMQEKTLVRGTCALPLLFWAELGILPQMLSAAYGWSSVGIALGLLLCLYQTGTVVAAGGGFSLPVPAPSQWRFPWGSSREQMQEEETRCCCSPLNPEHRTTQLTDGAAQEWLWISPCA